MAQIPRPMVQGRKSCQEGVCIRKLVVSKGLQHLWLFSLDNSTTQPNCMCARDAWDTGTASLCHSIVPGSSQASPTQGRGLQSCCTGAAAEHRCAK